MNISTHFVKCPLGVQASNGRLKSVSSGTPLDGTVIPAYVLKLATCHQQFKTTLGIIDPSVLEGTMAEKMYHLLVATQIQTNPGLTRVNHRQQRTRAVSYYYGHGHVFQKTCHVSKHGTNKCGEGSAKKKEKKRWAGIPKKGKISSKNTRARALSCYHGPKCLDSTYSH